MQFSWKGEYPVSLFQRRKSGTQALQYPQEEYEPVIRCSICTGEQVACMRHRVTGQLKEIQLVRTDADLDEFRRTYGLGEQEIRKIY